MNQDHFLPYQVTEFYFIDMFPLSDCSGDKLKVQLKRQAVERLRDNRRPSLCILLGSGEAGLKR